MENISKHISYAEGTKTSQKLKNVPNKKQLSAMVNLAENVFEPLRVWAGEPIRVNSFFRSEAVNRKIGGAKNSQHCANNGSAIDISAMAKKNNADLFNYILDNLDFDQLIWEFGNDNVPAWVHVSYCTERPNRKQVLKAVKVGHITKYLPYAKK
jgi:zinc D-Ala-D-Ala carboxypeptidase